LIASVGSISHAQHAFDITLDYIKQRKRSAARSARSRIRAFAWPTCARNSTPCRPSVDHCVLEHNAGRLDVVIAAEPSCCRASSKTA